MSSKSNNFFTFAIGILGKNLLISGHLRTSFKFQDEWKACSIMTTCNTHEVKHNRELTNNSFVFFLFSWSNIVGVAPSNVNFRQLLELDLLQEGALTVAQREPYSVQSTKDPAAWIHRSNGLEPFNVILLSHCQRGQ